MNLDAQVGTLRSLCDALVARIQAGGATQLTIDQDYVTRGNDEFLLDLAPVFMRKSSATGIMPQKAISRHTSEPDIINGRSMPVAEC
jgi:hypothetical protein